MCLPRSNKFHKWFTISFILFSPLSQRSIYTPKPSFRNITKQMQCQHYIIISCTSKSSPQQYNFIFISAIFIFRIELVFLIIYDIMVHHPVSFRTIFITADNCFCKLFPVRLSKSKPFMFNDLSTVFLRHNSLAVLLDNLKLSKTSCK